MSELNFGPSGKGQGNTRGNFQDLKPCGVLGCDELVPRGTRACVLHLPYFIEKEQARRKAHPRSAIYADPRWKKCRHQVFRRDNWTCVDCGHRDFMNRTRSISCDHANEGGVMRCPDPFDPVYCATRCNRCSGKKDGARGGSRSDV